LLGIKGYVVVVVVVVEPIKVGGSSPPVAVNCHIRKAGTY
jgi:hypothetical protein